jgi:hypothetical protein
MLPQFLYRQATVGVVWGGKVRIGCHDRLAEIFGSQ